MNNFLGHKTKIFILIFLICVIPRMLFLGAVLLKENSNISFLVEVEDGRHYNTALTWLKEHPYTQKSPWGVYTSCDKKIYKSWDVPLYPTFLWFFFKLFGPAGLLAILLNIFLFGLSACILYNIGVFLFGRRTGFVAAMIFAFYPSNMIYSLFLMPDQLFLFLFLLSIYRFVLFLRERKTSQLIFASALIALATLTSEKTVFFPLVMIAMILPKYRNSLKQAFKEAFIVILIYGAMLSPLLIYNRLTIGHYALSNKMVKYVEIIKNNSNNTNNQLTKTEIARPRSSLFSEIKKYFKMRKHFFWGSGTVATMKVLGYDTDELESYLENYSSDFNPLKILRITKKIGWRWFIFQLIAWVFICLVYLGSILSIPLLFKDKQFIVIPFGALIILYLLTVHCDAFFNNYTRYFISLVPFLALLCSYFLVNVYNYYMKDDKVGHAVR